MRTTTVPHAQQHPPQQEEEEGVIVQTTTGQRSGSRQGAAVGPAALLGTATGAAVDAEVLPCQEHPADLWFAELPAEVERAKELCQPCPWRVQCLAGALERREPWGVWGGQLLLQGRVVPRKRPRGRPRKDEVAA